MTDATPAAAKTTFDPVAYLAKHPGGLPAAEWWALSRYAAACALGDIVEIGSLRGRSALALAYGALQQETPPPIYCIEPHLPFTGIYGGQFGPSDRGQYYRAMLDSGFFMQVALVNLKGAQAAKAWETQVGMLFIDGDHSYEGVLADIQGWDPHLAVGGHALFDDATDETIGPVRVTRELVAGGRYERVETVGRIVILRKLAV